MIKSYKFRICLRYRIPWLIINGQLLNLAVNSKKKEEHAPLFNSVERYNFLYNLVIVTLRFCVLPALVLLSPIGLDEP
jgi:hypothetical protein